MSILATFSNIFVHVPPWIAQDKDGEVKAMNEDEKFLSLIHKNAAMGVGTIPHVMSMTQGQPMQRVLGHQLQEYRTIAARAQAYARRRGTELKGPPSAVLAMSEAMLRAQSAANRSTTKLAERMIRGSTMGVVQMTRQMHEFSGRADPELLALGRQLLQTEEQNIRQLKQYL